jgi:hypothetical protein
MPDSFHDVIPMTMVTDVATAGRRSKKILDELRQSYSQNSWFWLVHGAFDPSDLVQAYSIKLGIKRQSVGNDGDTIYQKHEARQCHYSDSPVVGAVCFGLCTSHENDAVALLFENGC